MKKTIVLDHLRIQRIIERFAYQIMENLFKEKKIIIVGVKGRGIVLAKRIADKLAEHSSMDITLTTLYIDKDKPLESTPKLSIESKETIGKAIVLVDDVLNSGRTLIHSLCFLLKEDVKSVTTAVLVDRIHRKFPIKADYVGLTLSTNIQEHVGVVFGEKEDLAYLD